MHNMYVTHYQMYNATNVTSISGSLMFLSGTGGGTGSS